LSDEAAEAVGYRAFEFNGEIRNAPSGIEHIGTEKRLRGARGQTPGARSAMGFHGVVRFEFQRGEDHT